MAATDLERFDLQLRTETHQYRTPMKFGGRVVTDATVLSVDCEAKGGAGHAMGLGSMSMGVAWAWPDPAIGGERKLAVVLELSRRLAAAYLDADQAGHPLDLCHRMIPHRDRLAAELSKEEELTDGIPDLAVLLASSPIESALFDAHGKAAGLSSYALLSRDHLGHDLSHYLDSAYRGVHLGDLIATRPVDSLPLYHLVGALDPLTEADVDQPVGDGLPETLDEWIKRDGLSHLKIKLAGDDLEWDVQRVAGVYRVATETSPRPPEPWSFSLDFNERCENEGYVLAMLEKLAATEPESLACLRYIEQPTARDLERENAATMHAVSEKYPVVIDESLVDLRSLRLAVEQGYSGIALKACKGHAEALLLGAAARHDQLYLCVQDLTCVGASFLHSASLAAHIPGVAAVESNGRQYCPAGNERFKPAFPRFFDIRDGRIPTGELSGPGLGYGDDPLAAAPRGL